MTGALHPSPAAAESRRGGAVRDSQRRSVFLGALILAVATLLAWSDSFSGPFVFDDRPAILANPTLETFWTALSPPHDGGTVAGRPLVNLSLALNRAISGTDPASYHVFNVVMHLLGGLVLFGLIHRTLMFRRSALPPVPVAFCATVLWLLHPLQTSAVTYVIQRAEVMMALCLLLTLYAFARAALGSEGDPVQRRGWLIISVAACFAGMACKEVMVVTPLIVLLYDRSFGAGSWVGALQVRPRYYAGLALSWVFLGWLVADNSARAGTAGFSGVAASRDYALTQCAAVVHYLRLVLWPSPLVFDYGTLAATSLAEIWPHALLLAVLLGATGLALWRAPAVGFLAACFFLILAPSSSVMPIATQSMAEHRMYLPLAALTTGFAVALFGWIKRFALPAVVLLAALLAYATGDRNRDYQDSVTLWTDTAAKRPGNSRAQNHAGNALAQSGRAAEAIPYYEAAIQAAPDNAEIHTNLGNALKATGHLADALARYEISVRLNPDLFPARLNFAAALIQVGRLNEALIQYTAAEGLGPLDAEAENSFGAALAASGRIAESIPHYERAVALDPKHSRAHYNFGLALARSRQFQRAVEEFRAATSLEPTNVAARVNLGNALLLDGQAAAAIGEYETALQLRPNDAQILANLKRARELTTRDLSR